jgi:predicted Ser/Thr protein kinase
MQLAREERAYRRLEGLRGIPRLGRRIDRDAIAVEFVEGVRLPKFHRLWPLPALAARLEAMLEDLHGRGVIHNDIRSRDNLLVTPARSLFLIDFSSALIFRPGSAAYRLLMPAFRRAEWRAFLKWKSTIDPEGMTEREWAIHRRFGLIRRLWPFNPKRDAEVKRRRAARRETR